MVKPVFLGHDKRLRHAVGQARFVCRTAGYAKGAIGRHRFEVAGGIEPPFPFGDTGRGDADVNRVS